MTAPRRRGGPFGLWLAATTLSTLGNSVTGFAIAWAATAHGAGAAGLVLAVESVPLATLILAGGVLADRWGIRRVMIVCDAAMAVVMALFAALCVIATPVWSLALLGLAAGVADALRRPAAGAFPRLFTDDTGPELTRLMASVGLALQVARVAGPAVGGVAIAAGGLTTTSTLDALTFAVIAIVLLRTRPPQESVAVRVPRARGALSESLVAAARTPGMIPTLLAVAGLAGAVLPLVSLIVPLAGRERHWSAGTTGLVGSAWVAGGVVVTLLVSRRGRATRLRAVAGPVLAAVGVGGFAVSTSAVVGAVGIGAVGVGTALMTAWILPRVVAATPAPMLARFQALLGLAQTGPAMLGLLGLAALAARAGTTAALTTVAALLVGTAVTVAGAGRLADAPAPVPVPETVSPR